MITIPKSFHSHREGSGWRAGGWRMGGGGEGGGGQFVCVCVCVCMCVCVCVWQYLILKISRQDNHGTVVDSAMTRLFLGSLTMQSMSIDTSK